MGDYEDEDYEDEPDFMKESVNLPFPVKVRTDELLMFRSRYGLAKILKNMMAERGGTDNDAKKAFNDSWPSFRNSSM